jgi:biopolymer transport protein ExbB
MRAVCIFLTVSQFPSLVLAQTADAVPAASKSWLQTWVIDGGFWMFPIGICFIAAIAYSVLCGILMQKGKFSPAPLKAELLTLMSDCRVRSAIDASAASPTFLGRMMTAALPHFDATQKETLGRDAVEDAMAAFAAAEIRPYQKWVGYFSVLAQICPMLGLFGTVVGMVGAFAVLAATGGAEPAALAGNISVALLTTWGGLMVAIPCLFLFFFFRNRLNDLVADTLKDGEDLVNAAINAVHGEAKAARIPEGLS